MQRKRKSIFLTSIIFITTTNIVAYWNPTISYKNPATDGPTKAPNANAEAQIPDINPYVEISAGYPAPLKEYLLLIINYENAKEYRYKNLHS